MVLSESGEGKREEERKKNKSEERRGENGSVEGWREKKVEEIDGKKIHIIGMKMVKGIKIERKGGKVENIDMRGHK